MKLFHIAVPKGLIRATYSFGGNCVVMYLNNVTFSYNDLQIKTIQSPSKVSHLIEHLGSYII